MILSKKLPLITFFVLKTNNQTIVFEEKEFLSVRIVDVAIGCYYRLFLYFTENMQKKQAKEFFFEQKIQKALKIKQIKPRNNPAIKDIFR